MNAVIRDGDYSLDGIPVGDTKITVVTIDPATAGGGGGGGPEKNEAGANPDAQPVAPKKAKGPSNYVSIPARYQDPAHSGLSLTVKAGPQTYNVELKP